MAAKLAIVVPCYNEEEVLPDSMKQLVDLLLSLIEKQKIDKASRICFVDDGSKDATWSLIEKGQADGLPVFGVKLAGNVGHQNALLSGLLSVKKRYDVTISIDADLQDDIDVIEEMMDKYYEGCDIVYGVRSDRTTDTFFKRATAQGFYRVMKMFGIKSVYNHADFRLMSDRAVDALSQFRERNLFLRGIVPTIGYKTDCVYYKRKERMAGESKYPLSKMLRFAFDGITSFSVKPMHFIMGAGIAMILFAFIMAIYSLIRHQTGDVVRGWTSLWLSLWFIGGIMTFSLGLVGEYVGKIYMEVKERPRYFIEKMTDDNNEKDEENHE